MTRDRIAVVGAAVCAVLAITSTANAKPVIRCEDSIFHFARICEAVEQTWMVPLHPPVQHKHARRHTSQRGARAVRPKSGLGHRHDLVGIVPELAAKAREIEEACGAQVISGFRAHAVVAGTHRQSLHAVGRAVDMRGNPSCIYSMLKDWPGGYSIDYARVRHVHISYEPRGREWGVRFVHGGHARRIRYARVR